MVLFLYLEEKEEKEQLPKEGKFVISVWFEYTE